MRSDPHTVITLTVCRIFYGTRRLTFRAKREFILTGVFYMPCALSVVVCDGADCAPQ